MQNYNKNKIFKNILITGGAGFIGGHLINKLSLISKKIFIIDNYSTGFNKKFPNNTHLIKANCEDKKTLKVLNKYNFDSVVHLAGVSSVEQSYDDTIKDASSNILTTINILNLVKKKKIKNFVYASSMCVYGNNKNNVNEKNNPKPISFYGISKKTAEEYINFISLPNTTKVVLRLFNVYGPGSDKNNKKHGMVGIFLNQLKNRKILVKGKLSRYRDFVFIDDVISVIIKSMKMRNYKYNLFNVCTSKKTTVKNLLNKIFKIWSLDKNIIVKGNTPGDQFGIYGNNRKIKKSLKIKKFINLDDGLKIIKNKI